MDPERFEEIVAEEFPNAIPERFLAALQNVAFVVEDEPSEELRRAHGLMEGETLLGHYQGMPITARGDMYGVGDAVLPDCIIIFQRPTEDEAFCLCEGFGENPDDEAAFESRVRQVVRETLWHEVAHHFGMDEEEVEKREGERDGGK